MELFMACALSATALDGAAPAWPGLPETNGQAVLPAQEWPREPGPRSVTAFVRYPGGELARVNERTGLMLVLHNWGGVDHTGAPDPILVANRYDVVAISVDYLQSGPGHEDDPPYDFGYYQALDALRALCWVWHGLETRGIPFHKGRIYATGGSGGGNVTLMANKLAPRTFACCVDLCGMARLTDAIAFGDPATTTLDARYSPDPDSPHYLNAAAQAIRYIAMPEHARIMKDLGNAARVVIVHGVDDRSCPCADKRELAANLEAAGLEVEPHFITADDVDGKVLTSSGHPLGDRTRILFKFGDPFLMPVPVSRTRESAADFDCRDEKVRYPVPGGVYIISYRNGYPEGRFERK